MLEMQMVKFPTGVIHFNNRRVPICVCQLLKLHMKHHVKLFSKCRSRNPYEVLGLQKSSSSKDVKNAYIKLCKELHPDMKPGDVSQHQKFVELNDAYTAIVNSENKIQSSATHNQSNIYSRYEEEFCQNWSSEKAWHEKKEYREQFHQYGQKSHLKFNSKYKTTNSMIVGGCFVLAVVGSALYITAYNYARKYKAQTVDEKSRQISENYKEIRKNAIDKGSTEQLDKLRRRWSA